MQSLSRKVGRRPCDGGWGFTLVEILVVVVILGVLAAIVIPQFTNAAAESRSNSLKMDLFRMRTQIEVYKQQHNGTLPTLANFIDQMTLASNVAGQTAAIGTSGYNLGPYIRDMPKNPNTGGATVGSGAVGSSDWYYDEQSGEFKANDSEATRAL